MANEHIIMCERCRRLIECRDDLVTSTILFTVVPYHEDCFARDLKGIKTFFLDNRPLNGSMGNILTFLAVLFAIFMLVYNGGELKWLALLSFIPLSYRAYSYFKYERHLEP